MSDLQTKLGRPIITGRPTTSVPQARTPGTPPAAETGKSFRELLDAKLQGTAASRLTFSKHAQQRVDQRGVSLSAQDIDRLQSAVDAARQKGITDSLVFMNDTAFIVNVPNQVVVTVVAGGEPDPTVISNINGAVIA